MPHLREGPFGGQRRKLAIIVSVLLFVLTSTIQRLKLRRVVREIRSVRTEDDAQFSPALYQNFMRVAQIALPSYKCKEFFASSVFIGLFAVKVVVGAMVSKANGDVLAAIANSPSHNRTFRFTRELVYRTALGLALTVTVSAIEYLRPLLITMYRSRLTRFFQQRLYTKLLYYQATALDNRLEQVDTVISVFCGEFAEHFAELPYYFVLPSLQGAVSFSMLASRIGLAATLKLVASVAACVTILRWISPPIGKIHSILLTQEDNFRRMLASSLADAENIALHNAGKSTLQRLELRWETLTRALKHFALANSNSELIESTFSTVLSIIAYLVVFQGQRGTHTHHRRSIRDAYVELQYIQDLNNSVKGFVVNFRELSHLTEFTTKLAEFDATLSSIADGTYIQMGQQAHSPTAAQSRARHIERVTRGLKTVAHEVFPLIEIDALTVHTPAGAELFSGKSLRIMSDEDWAIIGDNGCGKTSLLRVLAGLWPASSGTVKVDNTVRFLFAPQHSYMLSQCTLLEQVIFPDCPPYAGLSAKGWEHVKEAIMLAGAESVVETIGGWDSPLAQNLPASQCRGLEEAHDWTSLSGGQKQRLSMARIFYHVLECDRDCVTPVTVLDEATSMMDDSERTVFENLRRMEVRMISVTHRHVVVKHHSRLLRLTARGWIKEVVDREPLATE